MDSAILVAFERVELSPMGWEIVGFEDVAVNATGRCIENQRRESECCAPANISKTATNGSLRPGSPDLRQDVLVRFPRTECAVYKKPVFHRLFDAI